MRTTLELFAAFAAQSPERPVLRHGAAVSTYAELASSAAAIARALGEHGIRVAALAADNGPGWIAADLGAQLGAAALVPLPSFFSAAQLEHALADSGADGLLADRASAERLCGLVSAAPLAAPASDLVLYRLMHAGAPRELPRGTAKISYTSGTTGRPKGVCLTQAALDAVAESLAAATAELGVERHLNLLPLATLLENVAGVLAPLRRGAEIAAPGLAEVGLAGGAGLDVRRLHACIARYRPASVILLPQTLGALVAALEAGAAPLESLRFAAVGGAHVPHALLERAHRAGLPVYEGYGLTECASVVALNTPAACRAGSVGRALAHARVRIDEHGEIRVAGAAASGYVGDDEPRTEIATGDLGRLDADGFLYVTGRRKNVFITSFGRNVSPEWVESELAQGPIAQAALFGEARPWNVAVLVPQRTARRPELEAAVARVNASLPDYARVGEWLLADEPFTPANGLLTPNGRNRRDAIWNRYAARIDARYSDSIAV